MLEKNLESRLRLEIKKAGALALKFVSPGRAGVPDRIVLAPGGKAYFVEMKRPGGKLKPLQRKVIKDFKKLGFKTFVIDSKDGIESFIQEVCRGIQSEAVSGICNAEDNQHTENSFILGHGAR